MNKEYDIGTGYCGDKIELFDAWWKNTNKYTCQGNTHNLNVVHVIATENPLVCIPAAIRWHSFDKNLGHVQNMPEEQKHGGWWYGFMLGALMAYHDGRDFIYKEQDCFAYGNWVDKMYSYDANVVVGKFDHAYQIEQSLVLIKWGRIPSFIAAYMSLEGAESDATYRPELKFFEIMCDCNDMVFMDMPFGRNRPVEVTTEPFFVQQIGPEVDQEIERILSTL